MTQAILTAPVFKTRWRWNASRALLIERTRSGKKTPAPIVRMRSEDLLAASFPEVQACGETLPPGDIEVPMDHPIVRQTVEDCLQEAMDIEGLIDVLRGLRDGSIERVAVDTPAPSSFAHGILTAAPYAFLGDAPLEERRTQAVITRRTLDVKSADELGALHVERAARALPASSTRSHQNTVREARRRQRGYRRRPSMRSHSPLRGLQASMSMASLRAILDGLAHGASMRRAAVAAGLREGWLRIRVGRQACSGVLNANAVRACVRLT